MTPRAPMVRATFRVPPQLWHAAQRRADERGENVSEIIREALKRYIRSKP